MSPPVWSPLSLVRSLSPGLLPALGLVTQSKGSLSYRDRSQSTQGSPPPTPCTCWAGRSLSSGTMSVHHCVLKLTKCRAGIKQVTDSGTNINLASQQGGDPGALASSLSHSLQCNWRDPPSPQMPFDLPLDSIKKIISFSFCLFFTQKILRFAWSLSHPFFLSVTTEGKCPHLSCITGSPHPTQFTSPVSKQSLEPGAWTQS